MENRENTGGPGRPLSFMKDVKKKILGTVFRESPKEETVKKLEEAKKEIISLKASREDLQSKRFFMMKISDDARSIEAELKKIADEKKRLADEVTHDEAELKALYGAKDDLFKAEAAARADLKKAQDEKRTVLDDVAVLGKNEREIGKIKEEISEAASKEASAAENLEEVGVRLKFANANMDTLVLDSTVAKKTIDDLGVDIDAKDKSVRSDQKAKAAVNKIIAKLDELESAREEAKDILEAFNSDMDKIKDIRKDIKDAEKEQSAIPKRIAELSAKGKKGKEKTALARKEKSLTGRIEELKASEKDIAREIKKNKAVLEGVEKVSLDLKRLMVGGGLKDYIPRADTPDLLKIDLQKKADKYADSISRGINELTEERKAQSAKKAAVMKMADELNKLMKDAARDKRETELQRDRLKRVRDESIKLRKDLEARLREKSVSISESVKVNTEMRRVGNVEAEAAGTISRVEAEVISIDNKIDLTLRIMKQQKDRIDEIAASEEFFKSRLKNAQELRDLRAAEKELELSHEIVSKYERELRRLKEIEGREALMEAKLALADEAPGSITAMESSLSEMRKERSLLEEKLTPLRAELDIAIEKRDNLEMELSFTKEAHKDAGERKRSLERKLEFVTKESGSVKNIQEKLIACESRLTASEKNIAEVQVRLNFASATEEVVKERLRDSGEILKAVDAEIDALSSQIKEKEVLLSELKLGLSDHERRFESEESARLENDAEQAVRATELKKTALECKHLTEKIDSLGTLIAQNRKKIAAIDGVMPSYNSNLEKKKELEAKIDSINEDIRGDESRKDDLENQVSTLQARKREMMESSLGSSGGAEEEADLDKEKIQALRDERKATRGMIKDVEARIKELKASSDEGSDEAKEKLRDDLESLRNEREGLHKKIDRINEEMDAVKEGPKEVETAEVDEGAKELAQAIGEMDIKALTLTKSVDAVVVEAEKKKEELKGFLREKDELELEIESQKSVVEPLDELKEALRSNESEKASAQKSLEDKKDTEDALTRKAEEAGKKIAATLKTIEDAQRDIKEVSSKVEVIEESTLEFKKKLGDAIDKKGRTYEEYRKFKDEMDSIMDSTHRDRDTINEENTAAERFRKEVEDTRKHLTDAMSVLTGKTGSVDDLKLGAASSAEEERDIFERIDSLRIELTASAAAIEGIEANMRPMVARLKFVVWAGGFIDGRLQNAKQGMELESVNKRLRNLEEAKSLFDEYGDLSRTKKELEARVGELKGALELEAQLFASEQARYEAVALAEEGAEKLKKEEALRDKLEEKYKDGQEDGARVKGALDDITRRFQLAKSRWGKIEDLSRVEESLELKVHDLQNVLGGAEMMGSKIDRIEMENAELTQRVDSLEAKHSALKEEKESLETSFSKSKADFKKSFVLIKKSSDEARRFLAS